MRYKVEMKPYYRINKPTGAGCYVQIYNYGYLNEVGTYRYTTYRKDYSISGSAIGIWKPKVLQQ
jgi:hypothetical protein